MKSLTKLTVRYADTDQMGVAHHAGYTVWFECGRTDFFTRIGYPYSAVERNGLLLPLMEMQCSFLLPARYEDEITIDTDLAGMTCARLQFQYEITNAGRDVIARGRTIHACTNRQLKVVNLAKASPELYELLKSVAINPPFTRG